MLNKIPGDVYKFINRSIEHRYLVFLSGISAYEFLFREDVVSPVELIIFYAEENALRDLINSGFTGEFFRSESKVGFISEQHKVRIDCFKVSSDYLNYLRIREYVTENHSLIFIEQLTPETLMIKIAGEGYEVYDQFGFLNEPGLCSVVNSDSIPAEKSGELVFKALEYSVRYNLILDASLFRLADRQDGINFPEDQQRFTRLLFAVLMKDRPSVHLINSLKLKIFHQYFPELVQMVGIEQKKEYNHKDVFYHTCQVVDNITSMTNNVWLRFAALVHDIAKPRTKKFSESSGWSFHGHEVVGARMMKGLFIRLGLPNEELSYVRKLVKFHLRPIALAKKGVTDSAVRRLITSLGGASIDLITLCRADITSKNLAKVREYLSNYDIVVTRIKEVNEKDELRAFRPPVDGEEIMRVCNLKPSREVGIIKKEIERAILAGEIENTYEASFELLLILKEKLKL